MPVNTGYSSFLTPEQKRNSYRGILTTPHPPLRGVVWGVREAIPRRWPSVLAVVRYGKGAKGKHASDRCFHRCLPGRLWR